MEMDHLKSTAICGGYCIFGKNPRLGQAIVT